MFHEYDWICESFPTRNFSCLWYQSYHAINLLEPIILKYFFLFELPKIFTHHSYFILIASLANYSFLFYCANDNTVWRKILTGENIDEFHEFPAIRQYFSYQNFPFI